MLTVTEMSRKYSVVKQEYTTVVRLSEDAF